jgi:adenosylcobinamide-phosphate synthase
MAAADDSPPMSTTIVSAGSLLLLLLALGGEAVLGEMRWLFRRVPHPRLLVGEAVEFLERRLNRAARGPRSRLVRGLLVALVVLLLAVAAGLAVHGIARLLPYLWPIELLLIISLVAQRGPYQRVAVVARLLGDGGLVAAQEALRPLAGLAPGGLDGVGLGDTVRVGVAALARAFVNGVVGPCFWYVLLGLPGICLQQAALVLAARLKGGPANHPRYGDFGMAAARLNEALTLLPALLASLMLGLAAIFVPHGRPLAAWAAAWRAFRDRRAAAGVGAWPAAAMLAALAPESGADRGLGAAELERARMLYVVACLINAGAVAGLALLLLSI